MNTKIERVFVFVVAFGGLVLGGIHLNFQDELKRLDSRLQISTMTYRRAVTECVSHPNECPNTDYLRSHVEQNTADVKDATKNAWLFLILAVGVPAALLTMRLGVRLLFRFRQKGASDEHMAA